MSAYDRLGTVAALAVCLAAGDASAQALRRDEVLGDWRLRMTPAEDGRVTIATDTGRLDMPLTVTAQGSSGITCLLDGRRANCRLRRGELVIAADMDGAGRMTYTLRSGRSGDFDGNVRLSVRAIPLASFYLGRARMSRS